VSPKRAINDEEDARIQRMIAGDPDAPEATDEQIAQKKPFAEAFPELAEAMRRNQGGRRKSANPKVVISLRLDSEVSEKIRATGPGWQSLINEASKKARV